MNPKVGEISWLLRKQSNLIKVIGFVRDHRNGFFIVGGPTGSHFSGHNDIWNEKWNEYLNQGYVLLELAKENKLINEKWKPPLINREDQKIIRRIEDGLL